MSEGNHTSAQLAQVGRLALQGWTILRVDEKTGAVVMGDALGPRWVIDRAGFAANATEATAARTSEGAP